MTVLRTETITLNTRFLSCEIFYHMGKSLSSKFLIERW
nr:MAG TPA: hypothetical protein [Caudoviricetes sp.]